MSPDAIFSAANMAAAAGWLILIVAGRRKWTAPFVTGVLVPLLFAVAYSVLIAVHFGGAEGGFNTLTDVMALFTNRWIALAGWIHYLAFDLFVGSWEVRDAQAHGISQLLVIPCLVLTFLFGPAGLLLYCAVRFCFTRKVRIETN